MSIGKELIESAEQALAIAKGEVEPAGVFVPKPVDVAAVRKKHKLSQKDFAKMYGLNLGTLREWEQGRKIPDRTAQVLLAVIDRNPQAVTESLEINKSNRESNRIEQQYTFLS